MVSMTLTARGGPMTRAELDALPDDRRRHELIDGTLVVTPAPSMRHQLVVLRMSQLLEVARPAGLRMLFAPFDVVLADDSVVEPDLLVGRVADFTEKDLPVAPLLAVEVLSPSTRFIDLNLKRARYEAAGCASYWVVDPDGPSLVAWELRDGGFVEVADVAGGESWTASAPYAVTITPDDLVD